MFKHIADKSPCPRAHDIRGGLGEFPTLFLACQTKTGNYYEYIFNITTNMYVQKIYIADNSPKGPRYSGGLG